MNKKNVKDINNLFEDVFKDMKLDVKEVEDEKINDEYKIDILDELFVRLEYFQRKFGIVDKNIIDKSTDLILHRENFHKEKINYKCECGAIYEITYLTKNYEHESRYNNYSNGTETNPYSTYQYFYPNYPEYVNYNNYAIRCNFCDRFFKITSTYEFTGHFEILCKKRGFDERTK